MRRRGGAGIGLDCGVSLTGSSEAGKGEQGGGEVLQISLFSRRNE
jgi:hypothetical protein